MIVYILRNADGDLQLPAFSTYEQARQAIVENESNPEYRDQWGVEVLPIATVFPSRLYRA